VFAERERRRMRKWWGNGGCKNTNQNDFTNESHKKRVRARVKPKSENHNEWIMMTVVFECVLGVRKKRRGRKNVKAKILKVCLLILSHYKVTNLLLKSYCEADCVNCLPL
jgi:hypothetical protein